MNPKNNKHGKYEKFYVCLFHEQESEGHDCCTNIFMPDSKIGDYFWVSVIAFDTIKMVIPQMTVNKPEYKREPYRIETV